MAIIKMLTSEDMTTLFLMCSPFLREMNSSASALQQKVVGRWVLYE